MSERLKSVGWSLLLVAVIGGFFHECLFGGHSLVPTDILHQLILPFGANVKNVAVKNHFAIDPLDLDYPWATFWQRSVTRDGELPIWNPFILGGHPHLAETMPAVLSPFKLLYLALPTERAFTLAIILELALAGVLMFALLREVGRSRVASFMGGCAWALNSSFLMWYWRAPNIFCWTPLVLLLIERAFRRNSWGYALGAGMTLGLALLCGNIQAGAHLGFLCAAYGAGLVACADRDRRRGMLARLAVALLVGVLISAVQTLPALELFTRDAYRSTQARGTHVSLRHSLLGPLFLITFVFPSLTGTTESFDLLKLADASRYDFTGYIGLVPFTLFLIGACARPDKRVRAALWLLAAVLGMLFFTPLVKYLYHRFFVVAVFALAFVSAYGADVALDRQTSATARTRRLFLSMTGICLLVAVGLVATQVVMRIWGEQITAAAERFVAAQAHKYAFRHRPEWFQQRVHLFFDHYRLTNADFWLPLMTVPVAAAIWLAYQRGRIPRWTLGAVLVVLTVCDLTVLGREWVPQTDLTRYPLRGHSPILSVLENEKELFRVHRWGPNDWYILTPNLLMAYGLYDLDGNCSIAPQTVERLPFETNGQFNALLDLANVKYVLTDTSSTLPTDRFELVTEAERVRLYRNPHCLPRLQFFTRWEVVPDRARMLARMKEDSFDPSAVVLLEQPPAIPPATGTATITVERYTANRLIARVNVNRPGILLLADTWYPGWKARVDGRQTPLLRADYVLRAVEVPAGEHRVEFYFDSPTVRTGAILSVVTAGASLLLIALAPARGRPHTA